MNCEDFEVNLSQYLENDLNPWQMRAAAQHLMRCSACSQALEGVHQVRLMLGNLAGLKPPPRFDLGLAGRLEHRMTHRQAAWRRTLSLGLALAAAVAILLWPEPEPARTLALQEVHAPDRLAKRPGAWSRSIAPVGQAVSYSPAYVQLVAFQQH